MARRMFNDQIVRSDSFLDMPTSTRELYFQLNMDGDDDGFVKNPYSVMRIVGASKNDMDLLIAKKYILVFENGVIVIKHWRMHNYIRNDRYKPTVYQNELALLDLKENKAYTLKEIPYDLFSVEQQEKNIGEKMVYQVDTKVKLSKVKLNQVNKEELIEETPTFENKEVKHKYGEFKNVLLTDDELEKLKEKLPKEYLNKIDDLSYYIGSTGKIYKSHYRTILTFDRRDNQKKEENHGINKEPVKSYTPRRERNSERDS